MNPLPLVSTSYGLIPVNRAKAVQKIADDYAARRKDMTAAEVEARAVALGENIAEVRALWADGPAVVDRAIKAAVKSIPADVLKRAYLCTGCKKVRDDRYIAKCAKRGKRPCWIGARLRGCVRFEPAAVVG